MRLLNASVLERKARNRNLSWRFPLGNLLPKTRVLKHRVLEHKRRPNANASVLGTQRFRTLRVCFGSVSGCWVGSGWGRGGVGERGFCKGKECHYPRGGTGGCTPFWTIFPPPRPPPKRNFINSVVSASLIRACFNGGFGHYSTTIARLSPLGGLERGS